MSEENKNHSVPEETGSVSVSEETAKESTETKEDSMTPSETETVSEKEVKTEKVPQKKGVNLWVAGVFILILFAVVFLVLKKSGSILVDPSEWAKGGWGHRSYVYVELDTSSQADKAANFTFHVPDEIDGLTNKEYWIVDNYIYDVRYVDDEGQTSIILHKCQKDDLESADTNSYKSINTVDIDGMEVVEKGQDGKVMSVLWKKKNCYYQILTNEAHMLNPEDIPALVQAME